MAVPIEELDKQIAADPDYQKLAPERQVEFAKRVYRHAGYGQERPTADDPELPPPDDLLSSLGRIAKPAILPTIGEAAGAAAGVALSPVLGPAAPYLGMAGGGITGEGLNQVFGITAPSREQLILAGLVPPAVTAGVRGLQTASRFFPPSQAARTLNEIAPKEAARVIQKYEPVGPSGPLFEVAKQAGDTIPMTSTVQAIADLKSELSHLSSGAREQKRQADRYLTGLEKKIADSGGALNPADMQAELRALGEIIGNMQKPGASSVGLGEAKRLFSTMADDLDNAANAGAQTLKAARDTFRREKAVEDIQQSISDATRITRGQGGDAQFNASRVIADLKKDRFFTKSFNADEQEEIFGLFKKLNKIPALPPPSGVQFGSGRLMQAGIRAGAGAGLGQMAGGTTGATAGAIAATALPPVAESIRLFGMAMGMKTGRALIKELLTQTKGVLTPHATGILSAFVTAQMAEPGSEMTRPPTPQIGMPQ